MFQFEPFVKMVTAPYNVPLSLKNINSIKSEIVPK